MSRSLIIIGSKICPILMFIRLFAVTASTQDKPKAVLVDEFDNIFCTDPFRARIDNFFYEIQQRPQSIGYIIGNADSDIAGRFQRYFAAFQKHVRFRGFDPDRVRFYRGPDMNVMKFRLWIVPEGSVVPRIPKAFRENRIEKALLFEASAIDSIKKGQVEFGEGFESPEPCDWGLDLNQFAIAVNAQKDLTAFLIASSKSRSDTAISRRALRLTAENLTRLHGISSNRVKTAFAGSRGKAEMQLWLVPTGSSPPKFREGVTR